MRSLVGRRAVIAASIALVVLGTTGMPAHAAAPASPAVNFTNPIALQRADPHIFKHTDGFYYFTATVPAYDKIVMRRATTLQGLATAPETTIWTKHASGEMGAHIWAPEVHFIEGKWYVYFSAGAANDKWKIRMYALESSAANPLTGTWTEKGRITTNWDSWSLDHTTFVNNGTRYLVWAQSNPSGPGGIYLAKMSSPWTITGSQVLLSTPEFDWEKQGFAVNEGPAVLQKNGKVFLTYSASATDANYCLGMLTADASADLLNPASWTKKSQPVFKSNAATSQYGPGHNSFTVSEDGKSDILVYHDRNYKNITGDPLNDPNRRTRLQKIYYNADGTPNFGIPVADGATPVRFSSYDHPDRYIRHWNFRAKTEANVTNLADSQFRVVPGLAGTGTVSLESANFPGYYLRHKNFEVWVEKNDGSTVFHNDASFHQRAGLADSADGISFESLNFPGRYIRHGDDNLVYVQPVTTTADREDATYYAE